MPLPWWIVAAILTPPMVCFTVTNVLAWRILNEVNEAVPQAQRFGRWIWYPTKSLRLWKAHRQLFPGSTLRRNYLITTGMGIVSFFVTGFLMMMFSDGYSR